MTENKRLSHEHTRDKSSNSLGFMMLKNQANHIHYDMHGVSTLSGVGDDRRMKGIVSLSSRECGQTQKPLNESHGTWKIASHWNQLLHTQTKKEPISSVGVIVRG